MVQCCLYHGHSWSVQTRLTIGYKIVCFFNVSSAKSFTGGGGGGGGSWSWVNNDLVKSSMQFGLVIDKTTHATMTIVIFICPCFYLGWICWAIYVFWPLYWLYQLLQKISIAMTAKLRSLNFFLSKILYCLCGYVYIDYIMVLWIEQEDGSFDYPHGAGTSSPSH